MPVLPTIADTFRVTFNWGTAHGIKPRNVLHFHAPGKTDADISTALDANFSDDMWKWVHQDWAFATVDILKLDGTSATVTEAVSAQGSLTGGDWSNQVAGVVSAHTAQRGSRGRGRVFLGPVAESQVASGLLQNVALVIGEWETFRSGMAADGVEWCIASYVHADQHPVTNIHGSTVTGTQRRRNDQLR